MSRVRAYSKRLFMLGLITLFVAGSTQALHSGVGGDMDDKGEVPQAGCTCHNEAPSNSVTVLVDGLPYHYESGTEYVLKIQIIGGPELDSHSNTGGFSMLVSAGTLAAEEGYESLVQNWDGDASTLTHTNSGATTPDRSWEVVWTAPASGAGVVSLWLAGNSVNGDSVPSDLDMWNRLTTSVAEGEDDGNTRVVFSGNGTIEPPPPVEGVNIHEMGAGLRAHWLGLLGFAAVIIVLLFCGLFLRYGFSKHYAGRSNLLKLRIKHLRRGDQL